MKNIATKKIASLLIAATVTAPVTAVYGQTPASVTGTSGGPQTSANCGFIPAQPNYSFTVSQPTQSVSIEVSGSGDYTLLMVGPNNSRECILAHDSAGGTIQSRGLYKAGTYNLYVGDIDGAGAPFTLQVK